MSKTTLEYLSRDIFDSLLYQIFVSGVFHADPHPGNIYIGEDQKPILLDFGAVGRISSIQRSGLQKLLTGLNYENPNMMVSGVVDIVSTAQSINKPVLERAFDQFLVEQTIDAENLEPVVRSIFKIISDFKLEISGNVTAVFRTLLTLQGTLEFLNPKIDLFEQSKNFVVNHFNPLNNKKDIKKSIEQELMQVIPTLQSIPKRIDGIASQIENGDVKFKFSIFKDEENKKNIHYILSQILVGFSAISLGVLSIGVLFLARLQESTYSMLDIFGYSGLSLSVVTLLRIMIQSIFKNKKT